LEENRAARRSSGSARAAPGSGAPAPADLGADDDDDDDVEVVQEAARPMDRPGGARARDGQGVLVQDILQAQEELQVCCLGVCDDRASLIGARYAPETWQYHAQQREHAMLCC
jgi:hypothetical protein